MAKSFPSTPTAAIVHTQQVVSGAAIVAPSDSERAKARHKQSTTHSPSHKEVVVITSLPTHWPDKPVVGPLNSYLGTHGRAI
jgi:predicted alpha/beta hydrolase family esterase